MIDAKSVCSTSSTSSPTSAWPFASSVGSNRSTLSTYSPTCSFCAVSRGISGLITALNALPRRCKNGSARSVPRPPTSRRAAPGRTASSKVSTRACAMSCSTARSSTPCARPRSSSKAGVATTTPSVRMLRSAITLRPRRCSCQLSPHGRLRNPDQLRRPCSRWSLDQPYTNIQPEPPNWGPVNGRALIGLFLSGDVRS